MFIRVHPCPSPIIDTDEHGLTLCTDFDTFYFGRLSETQTETGGQAITAKNPHLGSALDDLLDEEGILAETSATAIKRVLAWEIKKTMAEGNIKKTAMARRMKTSRAALDRLLSPSNTSVTLNTMDRAARSLGKRLKIELVG